MYSTGLYMYMCSRDPCSCAHCVNKKRCIIVTVRTCTCVVECLRQFGTCMQQAGFHLLGNVQGVHTCTCTCTCTHSLVLDMLVATPLGLYVLYMYQSIPSRTLTAHAE